MNSENTTTFFNIASTILTQGMIFFTAPIFTRVLGPLQYGKYSVYTSWLAIFVAVIGLGVGNSLGTGLYKYRDNYFKFRSSILTLGNIICIIIGITVIVFHSFFESIFHLEFSLILVLILNAYASYTVGFAQIDFIYRKTPQLHLLLSVFLTISTVLLSLWLIMKGGYQELYYAKIIGNAVPFILVGIVLNIIIYSKGGIHGYHSEYWKFALSMGVPIVFHSLSHTVLTSSDRIMMERMGTDSVEVGVYSVFYSFSMVLNTILTALNNSWCPFFYDGLDKNNWEKLIDKCKNYRELFTVLTLGFVLLSREVGIIFAGKDYVIGVKVIPLIVIAIYFIFMYQFPVNFEFYNQQTKIVAIGTTGAAVINILLNYFMIPSWGMYGAAIATAISYFMLFMLHFIIAKWKMKAKFELNFLFFLKGLAFVLFGITLFYLFEDKILLRWVIAIGIGVFEMVRLYKRKTIF